MTCEDPPPCTSPPPILVDLTPEVAERIYRVLVAYAKADPDLRKAFAHHIGTLKQDEYRLKAGWWGVTCFFVCNNEWIVTTTREDESPPTRAMVDETNRQLGILRDTILAGG